MSLGFDEEREACERQFQDGWTALGRAEPVFYGNTRAPHPADSAWLRFLVRPLGESRPATLGSRPCYRWFGQMVAQVNVPENSGTKLAKQIADLVVGIFQDANGKFQEFSQGNSRIAPQGARAFDDGVEDGWFTARAVIDYSRDYIVP